MGDYESEILSNLERAETNLQVARELLERGYYDVSASRAYYAAFYAASALLLKHGFDTSKHSGVIALIHQHFVKSGKLSKEQGRNLNWLFELRSARGLWSFTSCCPGRCAKSSGNHRRFF